MAINATAQWWVRTDGVETNGGGFDSAISGAGTNYSDQAAAQLTLTDLATSGAGSTTLTSATGGFTAAMVGNCIRISAGTNFTVGYYFVTGWTNTNAVTVDRSPTPSAAGSAGSGKLGGAHAGLVNYSNGGVGLPTPAIATPLIAGNKINIRGSGSQNPTVVDYNYSAGYWTFPSGANTSRIWFVGYNGRPRIDHHGLLFYTNTHSYYKSLYFVQTVLTYQIYGVASEFTSIGDNCVFDQNGNDAQQWRGTVLNCFFKNSGGTTAGTYYALTSYSTGYGATVMGCVFENIRGGAIEDTLGMMLIQNNIIRNCKGTTNMASLSINASTYGTFIVGNTIDAGAGDGIRVATADSITRSLIHNNIISNHTGAGKYGINCTTGTAAQNDSVIAGQWNFNNIYNCTAARNNHSAGANDVALDPQYTNAAGGDYSVGTNMKAIGFPGLFPG